MNINDLKKILENKIIKMKIGHSDYEMNLYMKGKRSAYKKCLKWLEEIK